MIEFESFPDIELAFESLARERSGIELLNVRRDGNRMRATVFVPDGKLVHFENLIRDYLAEKRDSIGRPRDNRRLIDAIREIRAASLRALWTDTDDAFPTEDEESVWWEVWLPVRTDRTATVDAFRKLAEAQRIRVAPGTLSFPERTVLLASASVEQMQRSMLTLNSIAELRRAKETADFFASLDPAEQGEWIDDLLNRSAFVEDARNVAHVCLLDTGVNRGHPLLTRALASSDLHTVEPRVGRWRRLWARDGDGGLGSRRRPHRTPGRQRSRGDHASAGVGQDSATRRQRRGTIPGTMDTLRWRRYRGPRSPPRAGCERLRWP